MDLDIGGRRALVRRPEDLAKRLELT